MSDTGTATADRTRATLSWFRSVRQLPYAPVGPSYTDVRLFEVFVQHAKTAIQLLPHAGGPIADTGYTISDATGIEKQLVDDGILLFKYWLCCDQIEQEKRFAERSANPLKGWKLSPIDVKAREQYVAYTDARETMLKATHTKQAPWTLVDFNDQKLGRLTLIRDLLDRLPDTRIPDDAITLPPLRGKPHRERYDVIKPIKSFKA